MNGMGLVDIWVGLMSVGWVELPYDEWDRLGFVDVGIGLMFGFG